MEDNKVIYSMSGIGKVVDGKRYILKDIWLGYYYGAKIGVVGLNGSGKSTLLKIMAGLDTDFIGQVAMSKGYSAWVIWNRIPSSIPARPSSRPFRKAWPKLWPCCSVLKRSTTALPNP